MADRAHLRLDELRVMLQIIQKDPESGYRIPLLRPSFDESFQFFLRGYITLLPRLICLKNKGFQPCGSFAARLDQHLGKDANTLIKF